MKVLIVGFAFCVTISAAFAQPPKPEPLWQPFAANFDADAPVLVEGRIVRADWLEPRSVIWVRGASGPNEDRLWRADTSAVSLFSKEDQANFLPGAPIVVRGYNSKDPNCSAACRMAARDFTFATGVKVAPRSGTGVCTLEQLIQDTCAAARRPGPPPGSN